MDLKIVEDLLALMQEGGLTELHYVQGETEIRLSRQQDNPAPVVYAAPAHGAPPAAAPAAPVAAAAPAEAPAVEEDVEYFRSPMVGTFYRKPNPESDAYVNAGDVVNGDSVMCLIEAMKVFNEIKAEFSGTIVESLVQDGEAVEFDQPLFKIRTS